MACLSYSLCTPSASQIKDANQSVESSFLDEFDDLDFNANNHIGVVGARTVMVLRRSSPSLVEHVMGSYHPGYDGSTNIVKQCDAPFNDSTVTCEDS